MTPQKRLPIPLIRKTTSLGYGLVDKNPSQETQLSFIIYYLNLDTIEQLDTPLHYPEVILDINNIRFTDATIILNTNTHITDFVTFFYLLFRTKFLILDEIPTFLTDIPLHEKYYDFFIFKREWFESNFTVIQKFDKLKDKYAERITLLEKDKVIPRDHSIITTSIYHKLQCNNLVLFSKKRLDERVYRESSELVNVSRMYETFPPEKLNRFYGYSNTYGVLYEWIEDHKYIGKSPKLYLNDGDFLRDVDVIQLPNGDMKYIDYEK